jgi:hypothetical protein
MTSTMFPQTEARPVAHTGGDSTLAYKPNGPAAAAILAAGIGSAALGLAVILVEMSPGTIKPLLNLYNPVGPLSGKTTVAVVVYALAWLCLGLWARDRNVNFGRWALAAFILLGVGLLLTFPPVFVLFAPSH